MKKGFLSIALILAIVLMLTTFPGNKAEAGYYVNCFPGNSSFSPPNYNGIVRHPTPDGFIFFETRRDDPDSPVLDSESGDASSESDPAQNTSVPVQVNVFPDIMPQLWTDFSPYSAFPADTEWLWPDFTAMPSLYPILLWISDFSSNPYWLDVYPAILFYFP